MRLEAEDAPARSSHHAEEALLRIVGRVALRDPAALAQLYDATVGRIYGLALRMLKDAAAAEETVSDVYLQVWRTGATYAPQRGTVVTWLLVICRSRCLDALRARDEPIVFHGDVDEDAGEAADDPMDLLAATQRQTCVHAALAALAPLPRQLIALAFFRGYTHQEIATFTGIPLGSVKSLIRRALTSLRATTHEHEEPR